MNIDEFKNNIFVEAKNQKFEEFEIYYTKTESVNINVYSHQIDKYNENTSIGISFRGIYNGKMGYAYTEILDDASVSLLVECAKNNALAIDNTDQEFIYAGNDTYSLFNNFNEDLYKVTTDEKIRLALDLEKKVMSKDPRVINVSYCSVASSDVEFYIINSKGISLHHRYNYIFGAVIPIIYDGNRKYTSMSFKISNDIKKIDFDSIADEAVKKALSLIGASQITSGKYKIALKNNTVASLLITFARIFSADSTQKNLSLLKDKLNKAIASPLVNIVDDPHMEDGLASCPFDSEGVPTHKKYIVKNGVLNTLLYNLKTAHKDGVKTTGNASRRSYNLAVNISPTNFYIEKGKKTFDELITNMNEGILITDLAGIHAGANGITGDFSISAKGFIVKEGKVNDPIEQFTLSGNFYKLLMDIEDISEDLIFDLGSGSGYFGSPTLLIREMDIAGL
ncbi:TldD/PmbA family protein [Clostridium sp. BL-8]|uniref:TldD/PmbA family protein n=1 Tax=Clostridium sp. BL-8 TaxID=349938 RepID=UPI00098C3BD4|nr:TldD/PmbA family protein [Clostridium sp. BL-8]OOM77118.1 metalloprotease PmbA [Clostridium sp. BL-8]